MALMMTNVLICEACDLQLHQNSYEQHVSGKKHKIKQEQYDKKYKTIFVTGTSKFSPKDLEKIFMRYGEIFKVQKNQSKPFAFIQYVEKDSVERALNARVFAGGKRLFVHRYNDNRNRPYNEEDNQEKSRRLSETLSNTSQSEGEPLKEGMVGLKELPVEIPDPEWCPDLLSQAQNFVSQVELSAEMYQNLYEVKADMENLYQPVLPGCRVVVFGSCGSTLAFKNSDVDLFLQTFDGEQPKDFVRREAKEMYRSRLFRVITRIPSARVPIVKWEHLRTGWQGDLTANSQLGVCNSQLIRFLVSLDPRIRPLVMVIKYWAKVCGVTGSHVKFTTYSVVMLVIFYLQQLDPAMLPTIAQLQQMSQHKQFCLGWECSFCDEEWRVQTECLQRPNHLSLRELLTGFFRFYHDFDYNNVICPLLGRTFPVKDFESDDPVDLPDEMLAYKEKLKTDPKCKFRTDVNVKVQDPFELCLNITRNVPERTFTVLKEACRVSLELCEKEEESVLLKSLFSIDEESLDVAEENVKVFVNYNSTDTSDSGFEQWYRLTVDSILLVFKEIFKLNVDPQSGEVLSKVKKLESSQDVHTPMSNQSVDKLVLVCSGTCDVWNSRKKMSRFMNSMKIALFPFEREVCISNALYCPNDNNQSFNFSVTISSLEDLKKGGKGIEVQVHTKKVRHPLVKGFIQAMKTDFKCFIPKARAFVDKVKSSSPLTQFKESLKELFELKLENLPDLKEIQKKKDALLAAKGNARQKVLNEVFNKVENKGKMSIVNDHRITGTDATKSTNQPVVNADTKNPEEKTEVVLEKGSENEDTKNCLSSKNIPSVETQILIDDCFKPTRPNQETEESEDKSRLKSTDNIAEKFNYLLNAVKKINTSPNSAFTSEMINPFLASIEKVATGAFGDESKTEKLDETEKNIADCKVNNETNQETSKVNENKGDNVETPQDQEQCHNVEEQENKSKDEEKVASDEIKKSEPNPTPQLLEDKTFEIHVSLPSSSEEKTNENKVENKGARDIVNVQKGDPQKCERPNIYSERPKKQRKPNKTSPRPNTINPWQPWAGGGPPGCQPWQKHLQPSTGQTSQQQHNQGNHQGNRRNNLNRNTQRLRKQYPGLFRDSDH